LRSSFLPFGKKKENFGAVHRVLRWSRHDSVCIVLQQGWQCAAGEVPRAAGGGAAALAIVPGEACG